MKKAGDLVKEFLNSLGIPEKGEKSLFSEWENIVGKEIAEHASIADIKKGILVIEAEHPGWLQIVNLKKEQFLIKINELFPKKNITEIKVLLNKNKRKA